MVPESRPEPTENGHVSKGEGWFVLNARDSRWYAGPGRSAFCDLEGDQNFSQLGINLNVLDPGVPMAMYHWEADQEDFLVLAGEALLIVEGQERRLEQWDFVHCPPETRHVFVGAGDGPCVILAASSRQFQKDGPWGFYCADETARRYNASSPEDTQDGDVAYGRFPPSQTTRYREGLLPG